MLKVPKSLDPNHYYYFLFFFNLITPEPEAATTFQAMNNVIGSFAYSAPMVQRL
jgi:hypothetical protein